MGNTTIWNGGLSPFYEVYYLTVPHGPSNSAFWLRTTLLATEQPNPQRRAGLWLARFADPAAGGNLAVKADVADAEVRVKQDGFEVRVAESHLREGKWTGRFTQDGHTIEWDLAWTPNETAVWLLPNDIKALRLNKADVAVQNVDIALFGHITIDGERTEFDGQPAGQSHHWGYHYAKEWLWAHCNAFSERPGAWLEALSVKFLEIGGLVIPVTMLALDTGSHQLQLDSLPRLLAARAGYAKRRWGFIGQKRGLKAEVELEALPEGFVAFPYESPHNQGYTCHNTCRAACTVRIFERRLGQWRQVDELRSEREAAAEFCTPTQTDPDAFSFGGGRKPSWLRG